MRTMNNEAVVTKEGPGDVSCIVWTFGMFFIIYSFLLHSLFIIHRCQLTFFFINILATLNMSNGVMYDWEKVATSQCEGIFYVFR